MVEASTQTVAAVRFQNGSATMSLLALFILIMLPFILLLSESTGPHELDFSLDPILASWRPFWRFLIYCWLS